MCLRGASPGIPQAPHMKFSLFFLTKQCQIDAAAETDLHFRIIFRSHAAHVLITC